jgi:hypothetical protein
LALAKSLHRFERMPGASATIRPKVACGRGRDGRQEFCDHPWLRGGRGSRDGACGRAWRVGKCVSRDFLRVRGQCRSSCLEPRPSNTKIAPRRPTPRSATEPQRVAPNSPGLWAKTAVKSMRERRLSSLLGRA